MALLGSTSKEFLHLLKDPVVQDDNHSGLDIENTPPKINKPTGFPLGFYGIYLGFMA